MKKRDPGRECAVCKAREGFPEDVTPKLPWGEVNWATERRGQRRVSGGGSLVRSLCAGEKHGVTGTWGLTGWLKAEREGRWQEARTERWAGARVPRAC